jgi:hypothetical protein
MIYLVLVVMGGGSIERIPMHDASACDKAAEVFNSASPAQPRAAVAYCISDGSNWVVR